MKIENIINKKQKIWISKDTTNTTNLNNKGAIWFKILKDVKKEIHILKSSWLHV